MLGRIPSTTPQVSWFEFLLDKTGKLLKDHLRNKDAEPSAMQLCKQFLQKCIQGNQAALSQGSQIQENERTKQLRYLALVVVAYIQWDLDKVNESLPFNFQYLLMMVLLRNFKITEDTINDEFIPEKNGQEADCSLDYFP